MMDQLQFFKQHTLGLQSNPDFYEEKVNAAFLYYHATRIQTIFFDLETSPACETPHPNANSDSIIEIGAISCGDRQYTALCNPGHPIHTTFVNGITDQHVAEKPETHDVVKDFMMWVEPDPTLHDVTVLIAHNAANFDLKVLRSHILKYNLTVNSNIIVADSLYIAQKLSGAPSGKLEVIYKHLFPNEEYTEKHRALDDSCDLEKIMNHLASSQNKSVTDMLTNYMYPLLSNIKPFDKVFLNVSYDSKLVAKKLGARWDAVKRLWYAPDEKSLAELKKHYDVVVS